LDPDIKKLFAKPLNPSDPISSPAAVLQADKTTKLALVSRDIISDIFKKQDGGVAPSHKEDISTLQEYLSDILPDYDEERVYPSDIKKLFQWYNLLLKSGNLKAEEPEAEVVEEVVEAEVKEASKKKAPAKKAAAKTGEKKAPAAKKAPAKKKD